MESEQTQQKELEIWLKTALKQAAKLRFLVWCVLGLSVGWGKIESV